MQYDSPVSYDYPHPYGGGVDLVISGAVLEPGINIKRRRIFVDGNEYFLSPHEVAQMLIDRASKKPEEEAPEVEEAAAEPEALHTFQAIDYAAVKASDVRASQAFIDRMNTEIERLQRMEIQRQIEEEDDIECLMLLMV